MAISREPQELGPHDWYYAYGTHLLLVHEVKHADGSHFRTDSIKIPWRKIKVSLARVYKPRKKRGLSRGLTTDDSGQRHD